MKWCFYRQQTSTLRPGLRVWYCTVEQILSTLSTLFLPRTDFVYTPFTVDVSSERCNFCFWFLSPDLFLFWLRVARAGFTPSGAPVQKKMRGPVTPPPTAFTDTVGADTHSSHHRHFVEDPLVLQQRQSMTPARHTKSFPLFPNHYFNISGLLPCCKK